MTGWQKVKLEDILLRKRKYIDILDEEDYKLVTIKLHHKGVTLREIKKGSLIKSSKMSQINEGDFVLSGIDARNGAFGIVPPELDGAVITNDFWCLDLNEEIIDKDFFLYLTKTSFFDYICNQASDGTTQRIRLQKNKFFNYEIDLPPKEDQKFLLQKLNSYDEVTHKINQELTHQQTLLRQLRQAILQEAVQGKLTEEWRQAHPDVEPASVLLEKIKAEKARLVQEKKIKKQRPLPPITPHEIPFPLLEGWVWCRLENICNYVVDCPHSTPKYLEVETGYYGIDTTCINVKGELTKLRNVSKETYLDRISRLKPQENDIVFSREGSIGLSSILPNALNVCLGQRVMIFRASSELSVRFLKRVIETNYYLQQLLKNHKGIGAKHVNVKDIKYSLIPLPPLSEQQTIVEKVEKLLAKVRQLEEEVQQNQQRAGQLLQSVLREVMQPGAFQPKEQLIPFTVNLRA